MSGRDREPEVVYVDTGVRGRVLVVPPATAGPAPLVVGFHGYGEQAASLLEVLSSLPGSSARCTACPQALHPFYTRDGSVVASWMTSLDRELAIEDNLAYVSRVLDLLRQGDRADQPVAFVGFSQGVAMAYRAAMGTGVRCSGLVALGGDVPPELAGRDLSALGPVLIGRGRQDTWYDERKLAADLEILEAAGAAVETVVFDGGHEWAPEFRSAADRFLGEVLSQ